MNARVKYGVRSAYGNLKSVLMHRPGLELDMVTERTLKEFNFDAPVNRAHFVADYDIMLTLLQSHGVETLLLADLLADDEDSLYFMRHRPNMTYTRDLATVFTSGAVLMGPHLKGRWGDQRMMARAFRKLGIPILGGIEQPGFLEGGGVTMIGEDTAVASLCDRANEVGTKMLRDLILGSDVEFFLEVPLPFGEIHIDGAFMMLDERLCLIHEPTFETFPCILYQDGKPEPRHVMFLEYLDERGIETVPITDEECGCGGLNVVVTKQSKQAVGFDGTSRIGAEMAKRGWQLETFPSKELFLGNGGAHCMTCPIFVI